MPEIDKYLKKIFPNIKNSKRLLIIALILVLVIMTVPQYLKAGFFVIVFILLGGVSKIYHRFFKSTIGVDLILFTTIMASLAYRSPVLGLVVAWPGLIIADTIGTRFSYTSVVSLIALTLVAFASRLLISLSIPFIMAAIILTVLFEIITVIFYMLLGSPPNRILTFFVSHILFNSFLIFSFAEALRAIMV